MAVSLCLSLNNSWPWLIFTFSLSLLISAQIQWPKFPSSILVTDIDLIGADNLYTLYFSQFSAEGSSNFYPVAGKNLYFAVTYDAWVPEDTSVAITELEELTTLKKNNNNFYKGREEGKKR